MKSIVFVCCCLAAQATLGAVVRPEAKVKADDDLYKLPSGCLIGAGVSATQSEGATSEGGKAESVMDRIIHSNPTDYKSNNDQAADHYHRYKEDLGYAKQLKFTSHRFSISWARVFPTGDMTNPNKEGVDFYHNYIKEIKANSMEPLVTMYHFDHPYSLEESTKGWTSEEMVTKFLEYADFLFKEYGSEVKYWNPINEGNMYCIYVPGELKIAGLPVVDPVLTFYQCEHNMVRAHAKVYRLYKEKYFAQQQGKVGTSVLLWPTTPVSNKFEDIQAAELFNQLFAGTVIHPLVYGDYPPAARYLVDKSSSEQGLSQSKLPHFNDEDKKILQDGPTTDFIALNVYSGFKVEYNTGAKGISPELLYPVFLDAPFVTFVSGGRFDKADPELMKTAALWAWDNYHLPLIITENGYGDTKGEGVNDIDRSVYMSASLRSLVETVNKYKIPLISFHTWSLVDLYEFQSGYDGRPFGLVHVDYKGKTLDRTLKDSSKFFIEIADTGLVPYVPDPDDGSSTTPKSGSTTPKSGSTTPKSGSTTPKSGSTTPKSGVTTPKSVSSTPKGNGSRGLAAMPAMLLTALLVFVMH